MRMQGKGYKFEMTLDQQVLRLEQMAKTYEQATPTVLKAFGVQAVSWAVQDYRDRSDGGSAGGISWLKIKPAGAATRLRHRADWAKDRDRLAKKVEQAKPLREKLRRKLPKGASKKAARKRIAYDFMQTKDGDRLKKLVADRKKIISARKDKIKAEAGSARTGIDTGRLINSLVYGVGELTSGIPGLIPGVKVPEPRDNSAFLNAEEKKMAERIPAEFSISGSVITVGSNMKYAGHFAKRRPIFTKGFISQERREKLQALAKKAIELEFARRYGK